MKMFFESICFGFLIAIVLFIVFYLIGVFATLNFTWVNTLSEANFVAIRGLFAVVFSIIAIIYFISNKY